MCGCSPSAVMAQCSWSTQLRVLSKPLGRLQAPPRDNGMQPGLQDELPERPRGEGYIHALTCRKLFAQSRQLVSTVHMKADGLYPGRGRGSVSETGMTWKQQKGVQSGWKWGWHPFPVLRDRKAGPFTRCQWDTGPGFALALATEWSPPWQGRRGWWGWRDIIDERV